MGKETTPEEGIVIDDNFDELNIKISDKKLRSICEKNKARNKMEHEGEDETDNVIAE